MEGKKDYVGEYRQKKSAFYVSVPIAALGISLVGYGAFGALSSVNANKPLINDLGATTLKKVNLERRHSLLNQIREEDPILKESLEKTVQEYEKRIDQLEKRREELSKSNAMKEYRTSLLGGWIKVLSGAFISLGAAAWHYSYNIKQEKKAFSQAISNAEKDILT